MKRKSLIENTWIMCSLKIICIQNTENLQLSDPEKDKYTNQNKKKYLSMYF